MKKILTYVILPLIIALLAFLVYKSISKPVKFNSEQAAREKIAIQQMKDIRTLQNAYKSVYAHYAPVMDSLVDFYNNGKMTIVMQIGSEDDSTAVLHTEAIKKQNKKITPEELFAMYQAGDKNILVSLPMPIAVKDTLFNDKPSFNPASLKTIPFSEGDTVIMRTIIKQVSGVDVPLFEAQMPYWSLLKNMDHQLIVNLCAEREDVGRYAGLMVGSIDNPNNNAGNWE